MRSIAVALAILTLPFTFPALAQDEYDECKDLASSRPCHDLQVDLPLAQGGSSRYFVYLGWTKCAPTAPDCAGKPNDQHALPTNPVVGTLYQDTNGLGGLQRYPVALSPTLKYPADKLVLV
jgi:hypothetical protein